MKSSGNPIALLFSAYRRQVLALLLLRFDESFHVREIARLAGVPAGSLHRDSSCSRDAGLLVREPVGNQVRYRANRDHPIYPELAKFFERRRDSATSCATPLRRSGRASTSRSCSAPFAQGKERSASDVDVFVVGDAAFADVVKH